MISSLKIKPLWQDRDFFAISGQELSAQPIICGTARATPCAPTL